MRRFVLALAIIGLAAPTWADERHVATVTGIVDGDTLYIDPPLEDGNEVRLVGLQAPKLPLGREGFPTWPLAPEAKQALSELTLGKRVRLWFGGERRDRYGRWLAHLHVLDDTGDDALWVQGEMLSMGLARVYSFSDNRARVEDMLARERDARAAGIGIWALPFYAIRNPDPGILMPLLGTFQIIEGRVVDAAKVKGTVYLNFGADWRHDFTAAIAPKALASFKDAPYDPAAIAGNSVRVRGWLSKRNGPMIKVSHPEQIELLSR